jgi:soluble lytic murein transglycosylase-like protein
MRATKNQTVKRITNPMKRKAVFIIALIAPAFILSAASADIFIHIGDDGAMSFTNGTPPKGYQLFMKEKKLPKRQVPGNVQPRDEAAYDRIIQEAANKHGLDGLLIKAVIKAESDFDPNAVSHKGATGLMQIMPANFSLLSLDDPFDPAQSIMAGTRYLRDLWDLYQNWRLTLAAYNAGPMAIDQYGGIPPYPETEEYVERVLRHYKKFKGL